MKPAKLFLVVMTAVMMTIGLSNLAEAFHSGGVARCSGCHTMHNSLDGNRVDPNMPGGKANSFLLIRQDQSSTCLVCHHTTDNSKQSSYKVSSTGGSQYTPGGDFWWLNQKYSWSGHGGTSYSEGSAKGHNIIAADYGYGADSRLPGTPGGNYPLNKLSCISCHDPHGRYRRLPNGSESTSEAAIKESGSTGATSDTYAVGAYRLLGGVGYQPKSLKGSYAFKNRTPIAVSPSTYNRKETDSDTRVAYGKYMSEWCANCHGIFHSSASGSFVHPVSTDIGSDNAGNYNSYVKSGLVDGDFTKGRGPYTSLVPFEIKSETISELVAFRDATTIPSAASNSQVNCLTCHRGHASGWDSIGRWNFKSDFIVYGGKWPGSDNGTSSSYAQGRLEADTQKAMYDRPASIFASYQRSLCNKCHVKD